jgi:hypothetical protein
MGRTGGRDAVLPGVRPRGLARWRRRRTARPWTGSNERREEEEEVRGIFVIRGKTRGLEKELRFSRVY